MAFDPNKPVQWCGRPAEVLRVLKDGRIVTLCTNQDGGEFVITFYPDGYMKLLCTNTEMRLTNAPERTVRWVIAVPNSGFTDEREALLHRAKLWRHCSVERRTFEDGKLIAAEVVS